MYTLKHDASSDTKSIVDPAGRELVSIEDIHNELIELLHRVGRAESVADYWERRAKESPQTNWNQVRVDAAVSAMHAILSQKNYSALLEFSQKSAPDAIAAVNYADALISELLEVME